METPKTIGERAYMAIREKAGRKNIVKEMKRLDIVNTSLYGWKNGAANPSAYYLAKMALAGYDIYWILTGERQGE